MACPDTPTPAGNALIAFALAAALGGLIWIIAGPLDWFAGWRVNKAAAVLLLLVGLPVAFVVFLLAAFLVYAALGAVLEAFGVKLSLPAPAPSHPTGATPSPPLEPGTATHGLTQEEALRARDIGIYLLYACGTDAHGWPESYLENVAYCLNEAEIDSERAARPLQPGWDELKRASAGSLLSLVADGRASAAQAREFLRRIDAGEPYQQLDPPLTPEERAAAAGVKVWYVWYEDNFGTGGQRDSFAVAVCLTKEAAEAAATARGKPLEVGGDGYTVVGPCGLELEGRPGLVRDVLALAASGRGGAVNIDSSSW